MIHKTILFAVLLFAVNFSAAQQLSLGVKAGYTLANFDIKSDGEGQGIFYGPDGVQSLDGVHIGLDGRMEISPRWAVVTGLTYCQKGYKSVVFWPSGEASARNIFNYLNIPVVGDFRVWQGLSLQAGAEAGWLFDSRLKSAGENIDTDDQDLYGRFDLGIVAGLEYRIDGFFIASRYTRGLVNLFSDAEITDENGNPLDVTARNRVFQISAGYRYTFAR